MRLKGKRTALTVTGLGLVVLLAGLGAFRNEFLAGWRLRDLDSEDRSCRIAALERLVKFRSRLAIPRLQKLVMDSPDETEQQMAIRAILHAEPDGLRPLLRLRASRDPIPSRVMEVIRSLPSVDPAAMAVLVDLDLRESWMNLGRYVGPLVEQGKGGPVVPHLLRALRDADPAVRGRASRWLIDCPAAVEDLLRAARDPDERVREGVLAALRAPRWHGGLAVQALAAGLRDPSVRVRAASAWALGGFGGAAGAAIPGLIRAIEDPSFDSGWDSAAPSSVLKFHGAPPVRLPRILAVRALGSMDRREAPVLPALQKALENGSPPIRVATAGAILRLVSEHTLWPAAGTEALPVVVAAYRSLSSGRPPAETAPAGDDGPEVDRLRLGIVEEIVRLAQSATLLPALAEALVPALVRLLGDPSPQVRALVAETLGFYAQTAKSAIPDLSRLLEDQDRHVRETSASALEKIRRASE